MSKNPSSTFYWNDWDQEEGLRACTLAAQGLWMRCLCVMSRSDPQGFLVIGAKPCTVVDLARLVGESEETVKRLIDELESREVFSRTRKGTIYNRRMAKNARISKARQKAGKNGAEAKRAKDRATRDNPDLLEQSGWQNPDKTSAPLAPFPSSRSESDTDSVDNHGPPESDMAPDGATSGRQYAFDGAIVRVNGRDFARWRQAYPDVDLRAELTALDDFYTINLAPQEQKNWFYRCSQALANRQERIAASKAKGNGHDHYAKRIYKRHGYNEDEPEAPDRRSDLPLLEGGEKGWGRP